MGADGRVGLPMRTSRTVMAAVLAMGLVPWGGVALAEEYTGDSSAGVAIQSADDTTFYGSTWSTQSTDENGYPLYDENGNLTQGVYSVFVNQANCFGDTLYIPKQFNLTVTNNDGSTSVAAIDTTKIKVLDFNPVSVSGANNSNAFSNVKHLVIEDASNLTTVEVQGLSSLESVELRGKTDSTYLMLSDCLNLNKVKAQDNKLGYLNIINCPLTIDEVAANLSNGLKTLQIQQISNKFDFNGAFFPDLENLYIYDSSLGSWSLKECSKLQSVAFYRCNLTSVNVDDIPQSVTSFNCSQNRIVDTSKIVERFGEESAADQFTGVSSYKGLRVIDEAVANGNITVGSVRDFDLSNAYRPYSNEQNTYYSENYDAARAAANYTVESSNPSVVSASVTASSDGHGAYLSLNGVSAGTATVKIRYHYEGQNGTYDGTQEIPVTIAAHANAISSINAQDSLSLNAVTDCGICKAAGVQHQEGYSQLINVTLNLADSDYSMTDDQSLQVSSSDDSVVQAQVTDWSGINPVASLSVKAGKPGDAVLTISAATSNKPTGVKKTISVHVGEQADPVLSVASEITIYKNTGVVLFGSSDASSDATPSIAYYKDNGAIESLARYHVDMGNLNRYQGWTYSPVMANFATATSDNDDVLSVSQSNYFSPKKAGTANVTVTDIWGNKGVCKVTVKDASDAASKLSLTKSEMTVELGKQVDLQDCIGGLDSLTDAERNAIKALAFTSNDNNIATFKCDGTYGYANTATSMIARNLGDVTVTLNYSDQDVRSSEYYSGNWNPTPIGSMTIHVVESAPKAAVDVPSAAALTYSGSEQVGIAETADYAVSGGKATDKGDYTATLSLRDKDSHVWSSTGASDDITVKWGIAAASMSDAEVSGIDDSYAFTGKAVEPAVKCSFNGKTLTEGKDYELTFSDNVNIGEGKVTITGKGNFEGQVTKTFSIEKSAGKWCQNASGWWYDNGDGTYPQSCWQEINGESYYFNAAGYMVTGWLHLDGSWYYLSGSGAMQTGWQYIGGTWYWLAEDGAMATGKQQVGDDVYLFNGSGAMLTGWQLSDGTWYYLEGSGAAATGWRLLGGTWYWFYSNGAMATGWAKVGNTWYYFNGGGAMQTGWLSLGGTWYYLNGSGAMATGWLNQGGTWYWLAEDGAMATGKQQVGDDVYLFNGSGAMLTGWQLSDGTWYYLEGSGAAATGWKLLGGTWYWFDDGGAMATGWKQVGDDWYYFDASGAMKSNCWVGDYYLTASGAMARNTTVDGYQIGYDGKCQYVYWVQDGDTYHRFPDCPKLKDETNVIKGSNAAAGDRKLCMTCGR